jgi:hypothetical protein
MFLPTFAKPVLCPVLYIINLNYKKMRFQKKKITEEVRGVLGKYLDGTEKEFREATERIVNIIQIQHAEKLVLKAQRDNALIAADKSDVWYF